MKQGLLGYFFSFDQQAPWFFKFSPRTFCSGHFIEGLKQLVFAQIKAE